MNQLFQRAILPHLLKHTHAHTTQQQQQQQQQKQ
jgi:hypothetical protein